LSLDRSALTDAARHFEFLRSENLKLSQETHFQIALGVQLKELFETFLEDRVSEHVGHDVEPTSYLKAGFHLDNTDLIEGGAEHI
jgi:hypothetical protein